MIAEEVIKALVKRIHGFAWPQPTHLVTVDGKHGVYCFHRRQAEFALAEARAATGTDDWYILEVGSV